METFTYKKAREPFRMKEAPRVGRQVGSDHPGRCTGRERIRRHRLARAERTLQRLAADPRALADNLPRALPVVLMNTRADGVEVPSLTVDNYGGAYAMVRHLAGRGHRSIAFISGPEPNFEARERLRGYREALAQLLPGSDPLVLPGEFNEESGWRGGNRIIATQPRPDAIFAANDAMAIGGLFCLGEAGIEGPRDIALGGVDDIPLAR